MTQHIKLSIICRPAQENNDAGWLPLASLGKLTKEKNDLSDKINQLLALQQTVQRKRMNSEKTDHSRCKYTV